MRLSVWVYGVVLAVVSEAKYKCKRRSSKASVDADDEGEDLPDLILSPLPHTYIPISELPKSFDWRNVNGVSYVTSNLNQHAPVYCGSCWLHGGISTLNDRLKVARSAQFPEIMLARQVALNCGGSIAGSCEGGGDKGLYAFVQQQGLPSEDCQPYNALSDYKCSPFRNCMNCDPPTEEAPLGICYPVQSYDRYFVTEYGTMWNATVHEMKAEIFKRGPISCSVDCTSITHGLYKPSDIVTTALAAGAQWDLDHVVSIAGWDYDEESGLEYWIVRNSWGTFWGEQGWLKVAMGNNTIGIESECNWAVLNPKPVRANYGPSDVDREFASATVPPTCLEQKEAAKMLGFTENPLEVLPSHPPKWETDDMYNRKAKQPENFVSIA